MRVVSNGSMTHLDKQFVLSITDLQFGYPGRTLFTNYSAQTPAGLTLIRGGDGRGKTTLLRLIAGVLSPSAGNLVINGISAQSQPADYQTQVFWVEPGAEAFDQLTALEFFTLQRQQHAHFNNLALAQLIDGLDLSAHQHKSIFMLSTGTKRKVWLAAGLASHAAVTLFDEPFAALDGLSTSFLTSWLKKAGQTTSCAWILADYTAPIGVKLASVIDLGD